MRWLFAPSLAVSARILGIVLALTFLVVGSMAGIQFAHASAGNDANAPSVAGPNDAVIAHGIAALPSDQIAWQVVQATVPPLGEGTAKPRLLGFPLAIHDAILITDQATGHETRLAQWEAAFSPPDAMQKRESLASGPATYDQIAPVSAIDAHSTSGSSLLFAGDPFPAPAGPRDLDLIKGHLSQANPTDKLTSGAGGPLVVLVLQGQLSVATDQGTNTALLVGQVGSYSGTATLTSPDTAAAGTTFVAGIIGPEILTAAATPPIVPATTQATATSQTGSIAILARRCMALAGPNPPSSFPAGAFDSCPVFPNNWDIKLTGPDGSTYTLADAQVQQVSGMSQAPIDAYVWSSLPLGTYTFSARDVTVPSGVSSFLVHFDDLPNDPYSIQTDDGYAIPVTNDQPDRQVTIIFGVPPNELTPVTAPTSAATVGSGTSQTVVFGVRACPPGDSFSSQPPGGAGAGSCLTPGGSQEDALASAGTEIDLTNTATSQTTSGQTDESGDRDFHDVANGPYKAAVPAAVRAESQCDGQRPPVPLGDIVNTSTDITLANINVRCDVVILTAPPSATPEASTNPVAGTTLALRIFNCPLGNSGNPNDDVTSCTPAAADVAATLTTPGDQNLSLADATDVGPGDWVFSNLAASPGYALQETELSAGNTGDAAWLIQSHGSIVQITDLFGLIRPGGNTIDIYNIQGNSISTPGAATPASSSPTGPAANLIADLSTRAACQICNASEPPQPRLSAPRN